MDQNLSAKIDELLAGRKSNTDKVNEFLREDLHIDPDTLPLSLKHAKMRLLELLRVDDHQQADLVGTSLGLVTVLLRHSDQGGAFGHTPVNDKPATVTEKNSTWPEWLRIYASLVKNMGTAASIDLPTDTRPERKLDQLSEAAMRALPKVAQAMADASTPAPDIGTFTKFRATFTWGAEADVEAIPDKAPRWKRASSYPLGSILRIAREDERQYVRVGGLFNDSDVINLTTLRPIEKVSAWTVIEVLSIGGTPDAHSNL